MRTTATGTLAGVPRPSREPYTLTLDLTPDLAARWLAERNTHNRNLRPRKVDAYARDMAAGRWAFNGDPIRFDIDGVMLDGQHRCHAVVKSGLTIKVLTVWNLPPETQDTMDIGAARKLADQLMLSGHRNGTMLAAILRRLVAYENGGRAGSGWRSPTHAEMRAYLDQHPHTVELAVEVGHKARQYRCPSVIAMAWHTCAQLDRGAADHFFVTQLIDGIGLAAGDPARTLAKRLNDLGTTRGRANDDDILRFIFTAWNAYRHGRRLTRLQAPKGGWTQTNFPNPTDERRPATMLTTLTCVQPACDGPCRDPFEDLEGTPHFRSHAEARETLRTVYGWRFTADGRHLCPDCAATEDCSHNGHTWQPWRATTRGPEVRWCSHCGRTEPRPEKSRAPVDGAEAALDLAGNPAASARTNPTQRLGEEEWHDRA